MTEPRSAYDEKLESILRTAALIFAEKGYHQASIRDIARETRVSLSGLYYYFSSKEELLFLIQDHAFGILDETLEERLRGVDDPNRKLRLLIQNHLGYFASNMAEMKVLSHEAESLTGEMRERVNARKRRISERATEILAELRPEESEMDLRVATFALFGMMNWLYTWYRPGRDVPLERLADQMSRLFLGGYLRDGEGFPSDALEGSPAEARPAMWRSQANDARG